mgnify:FL=1
MATTSTFDPAFAEFWDTRSEDFYERDTVYRELADTRIESKLKTGDKFHRQYYSQLPRTRNYTRYSDVTIHDTPLTDENITINQTPIIGFEIDDIDELQANYGLTRDLQAKVLPRIGEFMDGDFLAEALNAGLSYDDLDLNPSTGTNNDGVSFTPSNVYEIFTGIYRKLAKTVKKGLKNNYLFSAISNDLLAVIKQSVFARDTEWGDGVGKNGFVGMFAGFKLLVSQSLLWQGFINMATLPIDGDTITLTFNDDYGTTAVVIRFKTTLAAANDVKLGATATATRDNLVSLLTNSETLADGTAGTNYHNFAAYNGGFFRQAAGTNENSGVTVKIQGFGALTVAEALTAAADVWTASKQIEHQLFGARGCISMVVQKGITLEARPEPKQLVTNFMPHGVYGVQTWQDSKFRMCDVMMRSDGFGAS